MRLLPWLANPGNPALSPHTEGKKGTCHTDIVHTVEKMGKGRGEQSKKLCSNVEWRHNKHEGSMRMWAIEDCWLHRFTNAGSTHPLACVHEQTTLNARECRPLPLALSHVPHKTPLDKKERWHRWMHWHVCLTNPQTLKGNTAALCC